MNRKITIVTIIIIILISFTTFFIKNQFPIKNGAIFQKNTNDCQKIVDLNLEEALTVEKSICEKCGGHWGIGPHRNGCNPKSSDSGKICTDNSQCEGLCLTEDDYENATKGKCSNEKFVFGCNREIINGKTQPILCRDD